MHCRSTVEIFIVFFSTVMSSNSSIAHSWLTSMLGPNWGSVVQQILCPVKAHHLSCNEFLVLWKHIKTVFWTNLEILFESGYNTLFHFGSTCAEEIIYKKVLWFLPRICLYLGFLKWDPTSSQMLHLLQIAHAIWVRCQLYSSNA